MKDHVTFDSDAFNTTVQKPEFVNPDCFGDDVLKWLGDELRARHIDADLPFSEDWGWAMFFTVEEVPHWIGAGIREADDTDPSCWMLFVERSPKGFWKALFAKGHEKEPTQPAVQAVHACLSSNPKIRNIRWHTKENFTQGKEDLGTPEP